MIADVVAREAAMPSPVTLVGHSFGAWVAGHAAARLAGLYLIPSRGSSSRCARTPT